MHLAEHLHEVPVHVIPCIEGRSEGEAERRSARRCWGVDPPGGVELHARARARAGSARSWTTFHLLHEREAAEILGIPYDEVMQVALIPVAYTIGTDFKPGTRKPLDSMVHWEQW